MGYPSATILRWEPFPVDAPTQVAPSYGKRRKTPIFLSWETRGISSSISIQRRSQTSGNPKECAECCIAQVSASTDITYELVHFPVLLVCRRPICLRSTDLNHYCHGFCLFFFCFPQRRKDPSSAQNNDPLYKASSQVRLPTFRMRKGFLLLSEWEWLASQLPSRHGLLGQCSVQD